MRNVESAELAIPVPNLRIMLHYYHSDEHLFKTVTMVTGARREHAIEEIARTNAWFGGRFSAGERSDYTQRRVLVESLMYEEFSDKYATPPTASPVFFYIRPNLSIDSIQQGLEERKELGEKSTKYLLVDLTDIHDRRLISFTVRDSHRSYRRAMLDAGFDTQLPAETSPDDGHVFHIDELAEVYARHQEEDDLSFEVQVWDPKILERCRLFGT